MTKNVAIFGAGIAGLTVAHELVQRGYQVSVYEFNDSAGGFFRSERREADNLPSEYSWHGFGPWYHNTFDLLKQIPFDDISSLYDRVLSRPMEYAVVPNTIDETFDTGDVFDKQRAFRISRTDKLALAWGILKVWAANTRSNERYSLVNAAAYWQPHMTKTGHSTWKAIFGPWIGSDWPYASLHHVGLFFARNIRSGPAHEHEADEHGPAWKHESMGGWSLLRGPSNESWFDRWVAHLELAGVEFHWESPLEVLHYDGETITGAGVWPEKNVQADIYVLSMTPFAVAEVIARTPQLENDEELAKIAALIQDGPHTQVSFRIAFDEYIAWPRERTAIALADSEFNLTLFADEQSWPARIDRGEDVKSLWTCTACVASQPGRLYGKPLRNCTKQEFVDEVLAQIFASEGLEFMIREANDDRGLRDFRILTTEVWHEWTFSPNGIVPIQPKWVTTTNTQPHRPNQATSISNLALAGAHTKTEADIWSIEGAVESGRRVARVYEPDVMVIGQHKPLLMRTLSFLDDGLYALRLPHVFTLIGAAAAAAILRAVPRVFRDLRKSAGRGGGG